MDLLTYYLLSAGFGLIQCMSVIARNRMVNKAATILAFAGIFIIGIAGWKNFGLITMLAGIFTIFLVGMVISFIILKLTGKK